MSAFLELLASGRLLDFVLVFILGELVVVTVWTRRQGRSPLDVVFHLGAGAALVLALRSALRTGASAQTALCLAASLPIHLYDLVRRFRRGSAARDS